MSEYTFVEKPFLDQLAALGWQVIDHGEGIPGDPTISYRTSFREVTLKGVFKQSVKAINTTDDGQQWLTKDARSPARSSSDWRFARLDNYDTCRSTR